MKAKFLYVFFVALFFVLIILWYYSGSHFYDVKAGSNNASKLEKIQLPFSKDTKGSITYSGKIQYLKSPFSQKIVHIIPGQCAVSLSINNDNVPLKSNYKEIKGSLCDAEEGFFINIGNHLKNGENTFQIVVQNQDGLNKINFKTDQISLGRYILLGGIVLLFIYFLYLILSYLHFPKYTIVLFAITIIIQCIYLFHTNWPERGYDTYQHVQYIDYYAKNHKLPDPNAGWEYFQPPVYYLSGLPIYRLAHFLQIDLFRSLQVFSVLLYNIFLFFGLLTIKKISDVQSKRSSFFLISALLLLFWPTGFMHSVRIDNDLLFYCLSGIIMYSLTIWWLTGKKISFYLALLFLGINILTKSNSVIYLVFILVLLGLKLLKQKKHYRTIITDALVALLSSAIFIGINFYRTIYYFLKNHPVDRDWLVFNTSSMGDVFRVGNKLINLVGFDYYSYFSNHFTSSMGDAGGRQFFSNFMLKTSLFGEFFHKQELQGSLANPLSALLLLIYLLLLIGFILNKNRNFFAFIAMTLMFGALLFLRWHAPFAASGDFRLIFPVIIPIAILYGDSVTFFESHGYRFLSIISHLAALLFVILSAVFYATITL